MTTYHHWLYDTYFDVFRPIHDGILVIGVIARDEKSCPGEVIGELGWDWDGGVVIEKGEKDE